MLLNLCNNATRSPSLCGSGAFPILCVHKRHLGHRGLAVPAPHDNIDLCARLVEAILDIPHGNVLAQSGAGAAACDLANLLPLLVHDLDALPRGRALDQEADPPPLDAQAALALEDELLGDELRAVVARVGAPPLLGDDPAQASLDGGGGVIQVVAVQAHARLEPQAVPRAQARELELLRADGQQRLGHGHGLPGGGDRDLEAVLAGVAAAADEHGAGRAGAGQPDLGRGAGAKVQLGQADRVRVGEHGLEDRGAQGALQGDEPLLVLLLMADLAAKGGELGGQVGVVLVAAGGVGDDVEGVMGKLGDDGVVDDAAGLGVQEGGQGAPVDGQGLEVGRGDGLQEGGGVRAAEDALHHVRDIKERGVGAGELVRLGDGEARVLHGHLEAAKGDHLCAMGQVEIVQGRLLEGRLR